MSKAANTRMTILQKSFDLIYRQGYQATSIDEILATTQVTKGAFYYHFKSKEEMALALIREHMRPEMHTIMIRPLIEAEHPMDEIYLMMTNLLQDTTFFDVKYGCPAINLIEEIAPLSETFNKALSLLMSDWKTAIVTSIDKAKSRQLIKPETNAEQVAVFIISGYGGIRNLGKIGGRSYYNSYLDQLKAYLDSLKPAIQN